MNLLFASSNQNKIREIQALLPKHIQLIGLKDIDFTEEIQETADTIEGNAKLKSEFIFEFLKNNKVNTPIDAVFADDSGLEVMALNGAPGVYSARYAGEPKNDLANNSKLLQELNKTTKRQAQFKTVIAYTNNKGTTLFEGVIKGTIAYEPRGKNGFGYDPLFIPQGQRSTFAEMDADTKNSMSHRSKALQKLLNFIANSNED